MTFSKDLSTSMWIKDGKWHNSKPRVMSQTIIVIQMTETGAFINSSEQQRWREATGL